MGEFGAIIGHSFGGIVAALADSEGVETGKLVTISSPASMEYILETFAREIGVSNKSTKKLADYIEQLTGKKIDAYSLTNLVTELSQPG